ncbi:MAG TPA: hypothetical protein VMR95_01960 [Candidatus Binatia bacterium]|nr:hypothetical protein [Candidatus Binatia bacterium]
MNDDTIADLKQFIAATLSQQFSNYVTKDDIAELATKSDLKKLETKLETKIDNIQTAIDESVIPFIQAVDDQVQDHEIRLKRLEPKIA